jgi:hypothetical protein
MRRIEGDTGERGIGAGRHTASTPAAASWKSLPENISIGSTTNARELCDLVGELRIRVSETLSD